MKDITSYIEGDSELQRRYERLNPRRTVTRPEALSNTAAVERVSQPADSTCLSLPYPPSVNSYWRHPNKGPCAGRSLISRKGREYRRAVQSCVLGRCATMRGRLDVAIVLSPPDHRRRDLDNALKGLLDAMQHAGVYEDDSQIDALRVVRGAVTNGGSAIVCIREILASKEAA